MFFAPTVLGLNAQQDNGALSNPIPRTDIYSLCLSSGNAEGLGDIRIRELQRSLDVLGVSEERRWVLEKPYVGFQSVRDVYILKIVRLLSFKDNITELWDTGLVAEHVRPYIEAHEIDIVSTMHIK